MKITKDDLVKHWSASFSRATLERLKDEGAIDWIWHLGDIGYVDDAFAHDVLGFSCESLRRAPLVVRPRRSQCPPTAAHCRSSRRGPVSLLALLALLGGEDYGCNPDPHASLLPLYAPPTLTPRPRSQTRSATTRT